LRKPESDFVGCSCAIQQEIAFQRRPKYERILSRCDRFRVQAMNMKLAIHPLTPDLWPALEELFATSRPSSRCWCMYGRIGSAYRTRPPAKNKAAFHAIVKHGPPPGLLAFDGDVAVGWCQLTPREAVPILDRSWRLKRADDLPVWSLSCLYVRPAYRRRGVTSQLIAAALKAAKRAGAPALEAYPFDAGVSPSASASGYASTFARLGFKTVARRVPARPIMRHDLRSID
jgi:GNAT superfamily N-acetyltransferase